jgi:nicotinate-nucleotide adenylyltransferase
MVDNKVISTAVFGGAFDPPHLGHVEIVRRLLTLPEIESVFVVPSCRPPHKNPAASFGHRFTMCHKVFSEFFPKVLIFNEDNGEAITYTCDMLRNLNNYCGKRSFVLVIGLDEARSMGSWKSPDKIVADSSLLIVDRPNSSRIADDEATRKLNKFPAVRQAIIRAKKIKISDEYNLSSTAIRQAIKEGRNVSNAIPIDALTYIQQHRLYVD